MTRLFLGLLAVVCLHAQAVFPGAVATDATLPRAVNDVATSLRISTTAAAPIIYVNDATGLIINMLLTIDPGTTRAEIVRVTALSGTALTVSRGYDSTTAAVHNQGAKVVGYVTAKHINQLADEIKAIETALGAGLSQIDDPQTTALYDFTPQTIGTLVGGSILETVNLAPCPLGVVAANTGHWLYITGGTGGAEAVLIEGGTCTSGAASGTLIIRAVNAHSGSTIRSATGGLREMAAVTSDIRIKGGVTVTYAPIDWRGNYADFHGSNTGVSIIQPYYFTTQSVFILDGASAGYFNQIRDLTISCNADQTSGWGIYTADQAYGRIMRVQMTDCPNGIQANGNQLQIEDVRIEDSEPATGVGVLIDGSDNLVVRLDRVVTDNGGAAPLAGVRIKRTEDVIIRDSHFIRSGVGALVDPGTAQVVASLEVNSTYFDNNQSDGVRLAPSSGGYIVRSRWNSDWTTSGDSHGFVLQPTGTGVIHDTGIVHLQSYMNAFNGLLCDGANVTETRVTSSVFAANSQAASGTYHGALFACSKWLFNTNKAGAGFDPSYPASQGFGLAIYAGAFNYIEAVGNDLRGNVTFGLSDAATGLNKVIRHNAGVDDTLPSSISSAAEINLGPGPVFYISDTTTIHTINQAHYGRQITLIPLGATLALGTSGNIATAVSVTQNVPIVCTYFNTKWYCK